MQVYPLKVVVVAWLAQELPVDHILSLDTFGFSRVPTRTEKTGKPLKNGKAFSSQGKSHKILENSGNFRQILFVILVIFK